MSTPEPFPNSTNLAFVEALYARFLENPSSVPEHWREYLAWMARQENGHRSGTGGPSFPRRSLFDPAGGGNGSGALAGASRDVAALQDRVDQLVRAYRVRGHLVARIDPLGLPRPAQRELDPTYYGLTEADMDRTFSSFSISGCSDSLTLRQILRRLRNTYCRSIGVQFMHIDSLEVKQWLQERMEGTENHIALSHDHQLRILTRLTDAVIFEEFLQKKYLGAKSFSLEGAESLIPLLDLVLEKAGEHDLVEVVLGMAHRGRLNVLANIMGKDPRQIFREFEDADGHLLEGGGDVKYHLGFSSVWTTQTGKEIHLSLCFNPSHLEFVNPVALGRLRAKQDHHGDSLRQKGATILIHGDAAFIGEGIVQETLNLSQLDGYATGGALHVIVNNQIGFTTSPGDSRSCLYATDVARMLQIPIFHVNGEDPEAVAQAVRLSMDFRRAFRRDVVLDMYGYRRRGHNEGDEPAFTQPRLYQAIEQRSSVRDGYLEHLLGLGEVTQQEADDIAHRRREFLEQELSVARSKDFPHPPPGGMYAVWGEYQGGPDVEVPRVETCLPAAQLREHLHALTVLPDDFSPHPKIRRWLQQRAAMADGKPLDWAAGEALALASLAAEGAPVRLTGQDSERGTFSHRHAVLHDVLSGRQYRPLSHVAKDQAPVEIRNSPLSEAGVLGFEYGYSLDRPEALVLWEAQFGDFCNVAQVIIDQFLVSAEDKWHRLSGLTLLLPHGFEGMGPEHSSARLERFLMLAAEDNIQVVQPTNPAQFFHCLRRQVLRRWRKPLIVMTPKSLLRHPRVVSDLDDFTRGGFQRILPDTKVRGDDVERILLCSGKVYYDLVKARDEQQRDDVAILRLEQFYPLDESELLDVLVPFTRGTPLLWVQEEPINMGAWTYLYTRFGGEVGGRHPLSCVSRKASASPATGSMASHRREQQRLLDRAFGSD